MEWLTYLLKVSTCTVLFFGFYLLVLRKLTFFKINRFYLLITLCLSFVIPMVQFNVERELKATDLIVPNVQPVAIQYAQPSLLPNAAPIFKAQVETHFDWYSLIPYGYVAIVIVLLAFCAWKLFRLLKYAQNHTQTINGLKLVQKHNGFTNCSFFNYVFVDGGNLTEAEFEVILKHEQVHARQYHSIDKMLLMIFKSLLWFNPIVYLYDKALEQVHEYEADETTSATFGSHAYANLLFKLAVAKSDMPLIHNFVKSPIKDRIKMLFHSKSKNMKKLMYLLALPFGLLLVWSFTIKITPVFLKEKNQEKTFTLVIDAAHGGTDQGTIVGNTKEKNLTLAVAKKIKTAAEAQGLNVILTRTGDETVNLKDRAAVKGDFLISLELAADADAGINGLKFFTSGNYERDFKLPKSNSMTYYIYKSTKDINGINISNKPESKKIALIDNSPKPGIVVMLGYLSNRANLNFITNEDKQILLANKIVAGIMEYKKFTPSDELIAARQKEADSFSNAYKAWLKSDKYKMLTNKAAKVGKQTVVGKIESLHSFGMASPKIDGFILNANGVKYRVYINPEIMKKVSYKPGDPFVASVNKAEVWYDSDYPVIQPDVKSLKINSEGAALKKPLEPKIISFSKITGDVKNKISYLENAVIDIINCRLEAKYVELDQLNHKMIAKDASLNSLDGKNKLKASLINFDLKDGIYEAKQGNFKLSNKQDVELQKLRDSLTKADQKAEVKVEYMAEDSVKMSRDKSIISLYGNAKISYNSSIIKGSKIVYNKLANTAEISDAVFSSDKDGKIYKAKNLYVDFNTPKYRFSKPIEVN